MAKVWTKHSGGEKIPGRDEIWIPGGGGDPFLIEEFVPGAPGA
jgi:hypothetical protein